jgi:hypothetical protein
VILGDGVHNGRCIFSTTTSGNAANSITLTTNYTGTLEVDAALNTQLFEMDGGSVQQPNGVGTSDINTTLFNWSDGLLNATAVLANLNLQAGGTMNITGGNKTSNDNLALGQDTLTRLQINGTYTLMNAGITMGVNSIFSWDSANANIASNPGSQAAIANNGGTFQKSVLAGAGVVSSSLPYIQTPQPGFGGLLVVNQGTLAFTQGSNVTGVSVESDGGMVRLGVDGMNGATLQVNKGFKMTGGTLLTARTGGGAGFSCAITVGDVNIEGGTVDIGGTNGIGRLVCDGFVTMNGNWIADVNLATGKFDSWSSVKGFSLLDGSRLDVNVVDPDDPVPPAVSFNIMDTQGFIAADFATKLLDIGNSGKKFTAGRSMNDQVYALTTP